MKVTRVPVTKEDLTIGFKKETQIRNTGQKDYTQINAANIKGVAYINTFAELKAIDTDTVDADSLFMVRETDNISIYRYDRNSTASEDLVSNAILVPNDNKGRFIKIISNSEANALSYLNDFKRRYYGAYSSNPATDPLGNPIDVGSIYYNTTENKLKYWTGSTWSYLCQNADKVNGFAASQTPKPNTIPVANSSGKLDVDWIPSTVNADKVNGFNASQTPKPNTIPVANSSGKLDVNWIPSTVNADKVNGFNASQTPKPNTIPVANSSGKLDVNWIPFTVNADKVYSFDASQTPLPNTIPVSLSDKKLSEGWTKFGFETYSRLSVATSFPASPNHNDLFWNSNELKLYKYDVRTETWTEIDWKTIVKASSEGQTERVRINSSTGKLEISPNGTNWYECIPAVGSNTVELTSLDNTSFSYKYWIAQGQTVVIKDANHIPIVFTRASNLLSTKPSDFFITGECFSATAVGAWLMHLSDVSTTSYYGEINRDDKGFGSSVTAYSGFRIGWLDTGFYRSYTSFALSFSNHSYVQCTGTYKYYYNTNGVASFSCHQIAPSTAYWIGTSRSTTSGNPLQVFNYMAITRRT